LQELYGLSLAEIGRRFMMASEEEIRGWATRTQDTSVTPGSAREYLRSLRSRQESAPLPPDLEGRPNEAPTATGEESRPGGSDRPGRSSSDLASLERLIIELESILDAPASRRSKSVVWTRIAITNELELAIKGELLPSERVLFENLADQLRAILTGRKTSD